MPAQNLTPYTQGIYVAVVLVMVAVSQGELSACENTPGGVTEISLNMTYAFGQEDGQRVTVQGPEHSSSQGLSGGGENGDGSMRP